MLRFRRYRVFLVFAVFSVAALYHFTNVRDWEESRPTAVKGLKNYDQKGSTPVVTNAIPEQTEERAARVTFLQTSSFPSTSSAAAAISPSLEDTAPSETSTIATTTFPVEVKPTTGRHVPAITAIMNAPSPTAKVALGPEPDSLAAGGEGRYEPPAPLKSVSVIHWAEQPDHFPVPSESILQLPTGRPAKIPKIQFDFTDESSNDRIDRERKLDAVKSTFQFSWEGYERAESWLKDELSPVSGGSRNPFCGWAATLVDALDTLWIMGMEDEFQQAVLAVGEIDFTTSIRNDIPLFETTIRYLGGLLSAYDLSGGKFRVLLDKAVELANVLMGAFDTPNRMPVTYYYWKPTYAVNPHRAGARTVLAEIGSLSVEFTRLAQITKEPRYYDAVARITNELEAWQNHTKINGLWPTYVDASGCKKPDVDLQLQQSMSHGPHSHGDPGVSDTEKPAADIESLNRTVSEAGTSDTTKDSNEKLAASPSSSQSRAPSETTGVAAVPSSNTQASSPDRVNQEKPALQRRQLAMESLNNTVLEVGSSDVPRDPNGKPALSPSSKVPQGDHNVAEVKCEPQGLASPPGSNMEGFTLGAMADSVYEYLPKQYMLLGGLVPQYKTMYERAADAASKYLMFRPMVPGNQNILAMGSATTTEDPDTPGNLHLNLEQQHLLCFAGGMYAIGAKLFNRPADLESAIKLTNGCVWAYESTTTGIMPESLQLMRCADRDDCQWNKTRWYEELDPSRFRREENQRYVQELQAVMEAQEEEADAAKDVKAQEGAANQEATHKNDTAPEESSLVVPSATTASDALHTSGPLAKRQLGHIDNVLPPSNLQVSTEPNVKLGTATEKGGDANKNVQVPVPAVEKSPSRPVETPYHYPTHEEYVLNRIESERIPEGMTNVNSRKYVLRPEAIESVFIMYRVTGDEIWREKGWKMFQAIQNHTKAEYGHSAIGDVTVDNPPLLDEMESFWLAETLKYFYLLFSTPDTISLDEYVLNTEAHPFKRPK